MTKQTTYGIIKPEGLKYKNNIEGRIKKIGLTITGISKTILTYSQLEMIYGHAKEHIPRVYDDMKHYLTSNPIIFYKIEGEDSVRKMLSLRGASNPADALPGTIRGDYAKGQDYRKLYSKGLFSKNVFHVSDTEKEAQKVLKSFTGVSE